MLFVSQIFCYDFCYANLTLTLILHCTLKFGHQNNIQIFLICFLLQIFFYQTFDMPKFNFKRHFDVRPQETSNFSIFSVILHGKFRWFPFKFGQHLAGFDGILICK